MEFEWWEKSIIAILVTATILLFVAGITESIKEEKSWGEFIKTHNRKVISKESATNSIGVVNGKIVNMHIQGKTGYLCDDGVTYYR